MRDYLFFKKQMMTQNNSKNQLSFDNYCESMVLMTDVHVFNAMLSIINLNAVPVVLACHRVVLGTF